MDVSRHLAETIVFARRAGWTLDPTNLFPDAEGHEVQEQLLRLRMMRGERLAGWRFQVPAAGASSGTALVLWEPFTDAMVHSEPAMVREMSNGLSVTPGLAFTVRDRTTASADRFAAYDLRVALDIRDSVWSGAPAEAGLRAADALCGQVLLGDRLRDMSTDVVVELDGEGLVPHPARIRLSVPEALESIWWHVRQLEQGHHELAPGHTLVLTQAHDRVAVQKPGHIVARFEGGAVLQLSVASYSREVVHG